MATLTREELLSLAKLTGLQLTEDEITLLTGQVGKIIAYIETLKGLKDLSFDQTVKNENVFRDDVVHACNSDAILAQAPKKEGRYFVVPKILD